MTVSMQITKRIYQGNGITRKWDVDFPLLSADDLRIYITSPQGAEEEISSDFSVDLLTHTLTYPTEESGKAALADGWKLTAVRATPLTQEIDLLRQGELDAEVLEEGYDKLTLLVQELAEKVNRSIKYPVSSQESDLETEHFLDNILSAKEAAALASQEAALSAQAAQQTASDAQQAIAQAQQNFTQETNAFTANLQTKEQEIYQTAQSYADQAAQEAQTAKNWALKTDGPVEGSDYSAKQYAQAAAQAASTAAIVNKITNCLTKIPQHIHLLLNADGSLTLKSGSVVYDGAGTPISIVQDIASPSGLTGMLFVNAAGNTLFPNPLETVSSAAQEPAAAGVWYDAAQQTVKYRSDTASAYTGEYSLPIALVEAGAQSPAAYTEVKQIFNGLGFIGEKVFVLPGVECLLPDGRNQDGTLHNILTLVSQLQIAAAAANASDQSEIYITGATSAAEELPGSCQYHAEKNLFFKEGQAVSGCLAATVQKEESGRILSLTPRPVFRAAGFAELDRADYVVESYSDESGNWYRVYKSGWVAQGGITASLAGSSRTTVTFLKPMADAKYSTNIPSTPGGVYTGSGVYNKTTTSMELANTSQSTVQLSWRIEGQGAE